MPVPDEPEASTMISARPKFYVNGSLRSDISDAMRSMDVSEDWISGKTAEIELVNWGSIEGSGRPSFPFFVDPIRFGDVIIMTVDDAVLIEGIVTALEGRYEKSEFPLLGVTVSQELARMDNAGRARSFEDMSLSEIVGAICDEYGFAAEFLMQGPDVFVPKFVQVEETDLELLGLLCEEADLYLIFEDNTLKVRQRHVSPPSTLSLNPNGKLYSYSVRADTRGLPTRLEARLFNATASGVATASAGAGQLPSVSGSTVDGPTVSESIWGAVKQSLSEPRLGPEGFQLAVVSRFKQFARAFMTGEGESVFDAGLKLGSKINFSGLGKPFNGAAFVSAVSHRFDLDYGLRTYFETERIQIGEDLVTVKKPVKKKKTQKRKKASERKPSPSVRATAVRRLSRRRGTRNLK